MQVEEEENALTGLNERLVELREEAEMKRNKSVFRIGRLPIIFIGKRDGQQPVPVP